MKKLFSPVLIVILVLSLLVFSATPTSVSAAVSRQNNYPIVFVHGLAGFDNLLGIPYWGGTYNISQDLASQGYPNFVAAVGPFSSNWDRACELYAQIVGGRVDYGKAHSEEYGHERYGRTYPGLYPQWGKIDPATGMINKIHLIGHSMGGQTIRVLAQLLENGNAEERAVTPGQELSPLFNGDKKGWISGILTIATPHDGSSAAYAALDKNSTLQQAIVFLSALGGASCLDVYDFNLDQWGLKREPGESIASFLERVESSNAWKTSRDLASWDLDPEGAKELNTWVRAQSDIYYFSQAASCTYKSLLTGHQLPCVEMNPLFFLLSCHIGSYTQSQPVQIDQSWWENDGLVSVITAEGPHLGSADQIIPYSGTPQSGKWNYLGKLNKIDHTAVIGLMSLKDPRPLFRFYAELLASLPQS
ncbi:putative acetyltransferase/hydrolase with alpha/beta hydrolase fold [Desulfosporosinus orientis DSM 765]|uniref:triacylglycerol lipase n=1 Tax=Desulfosporosinus orientis (strain ATCC 19365 / DSM 765 / NCIMB 8382 / VKM B-1628 / Singapore I) TaxID=768706 RepID=G7WDF7_DESOD|nr:lipase [Desulfosporosinus orientis]AET67926.1 putative acetyltransferase/hydrolase with alpha/beta hydrolase fold [Desulfosporosinus orientis DSM 765]